ncbi:MAG TPA: ABC transporter permease [Bryobacteraceae bacterium]|nr:ABC transporter permease [Bryobacteraceae bacterium]
MPTLWTDLRYGLRMLAANPGFTAIAILSLAIGIGANTATFSLADAILLRPLPVDRPSEIVRVDSTSATTPYGGVSYPDYIDLRDRSKTLQGLIAYHDIPLGFRPSPDAPAQVKLGLAVSTNFFDVLGVKPALGRSFSADEDRQPVVVLSDSTWESQFGRDRNVIGRHVQLSKVDFTIIGVAPKTFTGLDLFVHENGYIPLGMQQQLAADGKTSLEKRDSLSLGVYGRLQSGRTASEAEAELKAIAANLERAYPETNRGRSVSAMPELQVRIRQDPDNAVQTAILLSIAGLVLLIACANVASLLLSRARARSREIAIRLAIGASRGRLLRQLLTESLLLAIVGGGVGLLLAVFCMRFFGSLRFPSTLPISIVTNLDLRVLFFCAATSLLSGIVFGVAPALHTLRADLTAAIKAGDSAPSKRSRRFQIRSVLVVGQVAVSMVLLVAGALMVKDFTNLGQARSGFRTDHLLLAPMDPELSRYREAQARPFFQQLADRTRTLPGVRAVALGQHVPLGITSSKTALTVEGYEMPKSQKTLSVLSNIVDDHYLDLMHIPMLSGRNFDRHDTTAAPLVAIVNETMAKEYWPKRNAIGGRIHKDNQTLQVIGIAKDIKYRDLSEHPQPFLYLPFAQQFTSFMTLHVETAGDPAILAGPVMAEIRRLDPGMTVSDVQTMQHFFTEGALLGNRLITQVVTGIGVLGFVLATVGLYGVIAYSVSRRTREIGIRMAIGAAPESVARMVLRQGFTLTAIGVIIGLAMSLAVSELLTNLLVGVSPRDPLVYTFVILLLGGISMLACYVPARRAARVDPLLALRQD